MKIIMFGMLALMSFLSFTTESFASNTGNEQFTIYLVRHAEKLTDQKNPPLTTCGVKRAQQLATTLEQAKITQIYSTQTQRTEQTAAPLATQLSLNVISYSAKDLAAFSQQIKSTRKNTLIVGHSNTTPQLTALIANTPVDDITEAEYQMLYQVHFQNETAKLTLLKQPLSCH
ncbi:MAG: phosphoglycerate mutase family protein [Thalassotalea sp.]